MTQLSFSADFSNAFAIGSAAGSQPLTLLNMLKGILGIDPTDTTQDAKLAFDIDLAGTIIETYLDRYVAQRPAEQYFSHYIGRVMLRHAPVAGVVTVSRDGGPDLPHDAFRMGDNWYLGEHGRADAHSGWYDWNGFEQVIVKYLGGYNPIPADLAMAIILTAKDMGDSGGAAVAAGTIESVTIAEVGTVRFATGAKAVSSTSGSHGLIPAAGVALLAPYRWLQV